MKSLSCKDMDMDCPFAATGETPEEVVASMLEHVMSAHADKLAGADMEAMKQQMTLAVKDV